MPAFAVVADQGIERLDTIDHAHEIDVGNPLPVAVGHRAERPADRDARIVADDVNLAEPGDSFEGGAFNRVTIAHVAADRDGLDLLLLQPLDRETCRIEIDVGKRDVRAFAAEGARKRKADAARPAGDECRLAPKIFHCPSFSLEKSA